MFTLLLKLSIRFKLVVDPILTSNKIFFEKYTQQCNYLISIYTAITEFQLDNLDTAYAIGNANRQL